MLLLRAQLGHRPLVVGAGVRGDERRVVAEAPGSAPVVDQRPLAAALVEALRAVGGDVGEHADVGNRAVLLAGEHRDQQVEVLLVGGPGARKPRRVDPGRPPSAAAVIPESSAIAALPVPACAALALTSAFSANVSPVLGGQLDLGRQRDQLDAGEDLAELAQLVLVAGRDGERRLHCPERSPQASA